MGADEPPAEYVPDREASPGPKGLDCGETKRGEICGTSASFASRFCRPMASAWIYRERWNRNLDHITASAPDPVSGGSHGVRVLTIWSEAAGGNESERTGTLLKTGSGALLKTPAGVLFFATRPPLGQNGMDALGALQWQPPGGWGWDYRPGKNNDGGAYFTPIGASGLNRNKCITAASTMSTGTSPSNPCPNPIHFSSPDEAP